MRGPRTLCSIRVYNPGSGSGGGGTVTTDGVTIQGDGSGGNPIALKQVETDASLIGAGTIASTLKQARQSSYGWGDALSNLTVTANQVQVFGYWLPYPITVSTLWLSSTGADMTHLYDAGLYSAAGTLLLHTGAVTWGNATLESKAIVGAPVTVQAGAILLAVTGDTTAVNQFNCDNVSLGVSWFVNTNYTSSTGGALPASITAPTPSYVRASKAIAIGLS